MEIKPKKCKGTGLAKDSGCNNPTMWRKYGLCYDCYKDWLLNTQEGADKLKKSIISSKKKIIRENKMKDRQKKEDSKSIKQLTIEARVVFQKWIRVRDANLLCISCGKDSETWDAGHFLKAEIYTGLIFDEKNVNKQCKYCNLHLHGNEGNYRIGMIKKYGQEEVDYLDSVSDKLRMYKFTRQELIEIKLKYKQKLKELKNDY